YPNVGLSEGGSVVGAVAGHRDEVAIGLFFANAFQFLFRSRLRHEIIHTRFGSNRGGGERIVARDHHGANAHLAEVREALLDAAFDDVLQMNDAQHFAAFRHDERRAAGTGNLVHTPADSFGNVPPD